MIGLAWRTSLTMQKSAPGVLQWSASQWKAVGRFPAYGATTQKQNYGVFSFISVFSQTVKIIFVAQYLAPGLYLRPKLKETNCQRNHSNRKSGCYINYRGKGGLVMFSQRLIHRGCTTDNSHTRTNCFSGLCVQILYYYYNILGFLW